MEILIGFFGVSLIANVALSVMFFRRKNKPSSYEVKDLLHDLTRSNALIQVKRIAPEDIFIRRFN